MEIITMELKEYLAIIKNNLAVFLVAIILIIVGSFSYFIFRPVFYDASLVLNITRSGTQETTDYKYDNFYRLQADEKFAETVVQWLKTPRVVADILSAANVDARNFNSKKLSGIFDAENLSAQIVLVSYGGKNPEEAKKISESVVSIISKNTELLNRDQKDNNWFEIVAQAPVISKRDFSAPIVLGGSFLVGMFIAFWVVMIRHYLKK